MALTTTAVVLTGLKLPSSQTTRVDQLRQQVEKAIKGYCKWEIEAAANQVEFYDGNGYRDIILRQPYVSSIDNVWLDNTGAYGDGPSAFASTSVLTKGTDYVLVKTGADGKAGLLRRLTNSAHYYPSDLVFQRGAGGLSYRRPAYWPAGYGNIKVQYDYGLSTIPADIVLAVTMGVGLIMNSVRSGFPITSESLGDYSYSLSMEKSWGDVRSILAPYRLLAA